MLELAAAEAAVVALLDETFGRAATQDIVFSIEDAHSRRQWQRPLDIREAVA